MTAQTARGRDALLPNLASKHPHGLVVHFDAGVFPHGLGRDASESDVTQPEVVCHGDDCDLAADIEPSRFEFSHADPLFPTAFGPDLDLTLLGAPDINDQPGRANAGCPPYPPLTTTDLDALARFGLTPEIMADPSLIDDDTEEEPHAI